MMSDDEDGGKDAFGGVSVIRVVPRVGAQSGGTGHSAVANLIPL